MVEREGVRKRRAALCVFAMAVLLFLWMGVTAVRNGWGLSALTAFVMATVWMAVAIFVLIDKGKPAASSHRRAPRVDVASGDAGDFVELLQSTSMPEIEACRARLDAAGIEVSIRHEYSGMVPGMAIHLLVRKRDLVQSAELLSPEDTSLGGGRI